MNISCSSCKDQGPHPHQPRKPPIALTSVSGSLWKICSKICTGTLVWSEKRPIINGNASTPQKNCTHGMRLHKWETPPDMSARSGNHHKKHTYHNSGGPQRTLAHTRLKLNECICRHGASVGTIGKNANNHRRCPVFQRDPLINRETMVLTETGWIEGSPLDGGCDKFFFSSH